MNNMKLIVYISLLFVGYNIHAMDTSKSSEKAMIKKEIQARYNELLSNFNNEVNEAALSIDPEQLQTFLDLAYSPATEKKLMEQAEADVAASRLARRNQSDKSGMHHTSPQKKSQPSKTLQIKNRNRGLNRYSGQ